MKKTLLIAGALLALSASLASAQGINLSWTDCGTFGTASKTFNCAVNTGSNILMASAVAPVLDDLVSEEAVIDLQSNKATLSDWWNLGTGGCHASAFSGNAIFSALSSCLDPWAGSGAGGVQYVYGYGGANRARIKGVFAVATGSPTDGVSEYYMQQVIIKNTLTTGTGACAGCQDGACIVLNSVKLLQPATLNHDVTLTNPALQNYVSWQSGSGGVAGGCPGATPTRNSTWGSVKSLYR